MVPNQIARARSHGRITRAVSPCSRLRAQTITHLTSQHLSHPSERRSRERRLHAVTSGSRAPKAPRRWSPTPRGLPRLHGRLVVRAVSLRLTRTTHTARTRKTPASPSATGSPSTSSRASRIAIKFTLPQQPHPRGPRATSSARAPPHAHPRHRTSSGTTEFTLPHFIPTSRRSFVPPRSPRRRTW